MKRMIGAALALLMTSGAAMAQSTDALTIQHQRMKNALSVAPYPGGPTIGACQVVMIEAVTQLGEARKAQGGNFTQAEWQTGLDALNQLSSGTHNYSFTQAECLEIITKEADIEVLPENDRDRKMLEEFEKERLPKLLNDPRGMKVDTSKSSGCTNKKLDAHVPLC